MSSTGFAICVDLSGIKTCTDCFSKIPNEAKLTQSYSFWPKKKKIPSNMNKSKGYNQLLEGFHLISQPLMPHWQLQWLDQLNRSLIQVLSLFYICKGGKEVQLNPTDNVPQEQSNENMGQAQIQVLRTTGTLEVEKLMFRNKPEHVRMWQAVISKNFLWWPITCWTWMWKF